MLSINSINRVNKLMIIINKFIELVISILYKFIKYFLNNYLCSKYMVSYVVVNLLSN